MGQPTSNVIPSSVTPTQTDFYIIQDISYISSGTANAIETNLPSIEYANLITAGYGRFTHNYYYVILEDNSIVTNINNFTPDLLITIGDGFYYLSKPTGIIVDSSIPQLAGYPVNNIVAASESLYKVKTPNKTNIPGADGEMITLTAGNYYIVINPSTAKIDSSNIPNIVGRRGDDISEVSGGLSHYYVSFFSDSTVTTNIPFPFENFNMNDYQVLISGNTWYIRDMLEDGHMMGTNLQTNIAITSGNLITLSYF